MKRYQRGVSLMEHDRDRWEQKGVEGLTLKSSKKEG